MKAMRKSLKEADYNKAASVLGMVILDTLTAVLMFYILYWMFSIPNIWIALVFISSAIMRSGLYDKYKN